jgi:GAF domain-containing protein
MSYRILCVDPDTGAREGTVGSLRTELSDLEPAIETAGSVAKATASLTTDTDVVITEYRLPDGTGLDVINATRERAPDAACILYTDADPDAIDTDDLQGSITEYVGKESIFGRERLTGLLRTTLEAGSQRTYPLPQREGARLAALQSYNLDTPELLTTLDRITGLAAAHFGVEQASINLIDEHSQEFLACHGGAEDWETMDREDSICTFTILEDAHVMAVEDVREDPRFESRSEQLVESGIRSYLGANLVTPSGLVIGPLCVYDEEPRTFSADEKAYLRELAAVAMDCISLHARLDSKVVVDGGIATAAKSDTDGGIDTDEESDTDGTGDVEGGRS